MLLLLTKYVSGLFGTNDGIKHNEFTTPSGDVMSNDMTDEEIFHYAELCKYLNFYVNV